MTNNYKQKDIKIKIEYEESRIDKENGIYYGGLKNPKYLKELRIDISEDLSYNYEKDVWEKSGKYNLELSGSDRALKELGKYLINLSLFKTKDPDYHDHFDNILNDMKEEKTNIIIRKSIN